MSRKPSLFLAIVCLGAACSETPPPPNACAVDADCKVCQRCVDQRCIEDKTSAVCSGAVCGNGAVEPGETCDGSCPAVCDDEKVCTTNVKTGVASSCNVTCTFEPITACGPSDGCCPAGCSVSNDGDCGKCGNGKVEAPEKCDGDCPAGCTDADACTRDVLTGSAGNCDAECTHTRITTCVNGDGCCATGCLPTNDDDCCIPLTACPASNECGTISDGCGGTLVCGSCPSGQTCGGGGVQYQCGCATEWCPFNVPGHYFNALWGSSPRSVWAVGGPASAGGGAVVKYSWSGDRREAPAWRPQSGTFPEELNAVGGSSDTNVWAVGWNAKAHRFNGTQWSQVPHALGSLHQFLSVWAWSENDVWIGGYTAVTGYPTDLVVAHWDGLGMEVLADSIAAPYDYYVWGIHGSAADDVWLVGSMDGPAAGAYAWSWQGGGFTKEPMPAGIGHARAVYVAGPMAAFAISGAKILVWDGYSWQQDFLTGNTEELNALHGTSATDVYAVGKNGTILHFDGASWTRMDSGTTDELRAVWAYKNAAGQPGGAFVAGGASTLMQHIR